MTANIANAIPLLTHHLGVWEGEYVHFDADHREIDRHSSRLLCRFAVEPDGTEKLVQTNIYNWPDGSREIRFFEGRLSGGRILISNENIDGWVAALEGDETERTVMVLWTRVGAPDFRYYEMITLSEDGQSKNRTWHWYDKGRLFQRTLINEHYAGPDWQAHDHPDFYAYRPRAMR